MAQAMMALSAMTNAYAAKTQGDASAAQYMAQSQADAYNAAAKRQKAESTLLFGKYKAEESMQVGNVMEEQVRRQGRLEAGEMEAAGAQSGTGVDGSNEDVERQHAIMSELDALNVRYGAVLSARDITTQSELEAADYRNAAVLDTYYSRAHRDASQRARTLGNIGAVGALLGGAGSIAGRSGGGGGGGGGGGE